MVWSIMSGLGGLGCNSKDVRKPSQRGAHRWTQERANPTISCSPKPLPIEWSRRVFSAEPQVDETNERRFAFGCSQAGIPCGTCRIATAVTKSGHGIANLRLHAGLTEPSPSTTRKLFQKRFIAALRTPLWLLSGWGCRDQRLSRGRRDPGRRRGPWQLFAGIPR